MISLPFIAQHVIDKKLVLGLTRLSFPLVRFRLNQWTEHEAQISERDCLFFSQNNKIFWLSNIADTSFEKFRSCARVCGLFSLIVLFGRWLDEQTNPLTCRAKDENRQKDHSASREVWTIERQLVFCNRTSYIPTAFSVSGPGLRTKPWVWNYVRNAI